MELRGRSQGKRREDEYPVQFLYLDRKMQSLLSKKIRDIERESRYREIYAEG